MKGENISRKTGIIILAAGKGTRMKSDTPKVLHKLGGKTMLERVISTAQSFDNSDIVVVLKHEYEQISPTLSGDITVALQSDTPGTGSGALAGLEALNSDVQSVLILSGDTPLITSQTLSELAKVHYQEGNAATVLTNYTTKPFGYGRIIREGDKVTGIIEEKDATDAQKQIQETNSGIYLFDAAVLRELLPKVGTKNSQNEMYLTDVISLTVANSKRVGAFQTDKFYEIAGVNDRQQLAELARILNRQILERHMLNGVTIIDPQSTWIDDDVEIANDVLIEPNCYITNAARISKGAKIYLGSRIIGGEVGENADIGPYAYLRPGNDLGQSSKVGAFVEVKNSKVGANSKVPHLSYVGDATIGTNSNVGAGSIFANYDGVNKHQTVIGDNVKIGSKTVFVAPVHVGDNVYTGAASLIRKDVPSGALAYSKNEQVEVSSWTEEHRAKKEQKIRVIK